MSIVENNTIRLNKYLAEAGVCSRREADRLIEQGRVSVDGRVATLGDRVSDDMEVCVNGQRLSGTNKKIYLAFYKPKGIVCTAEKREKNNVIDYIHYPERITYSGRLDKESEGLLILTNDGELIDAMMRARNHHEKEYEVVVNKEVTDSFLYQLSKGVYLEELDTTTRRCKTERIDQKSFRIVLTQGLNRQIRRMCETFGYRVRALKRVRVMNITLEGLQVGSYRKLTSEEVEKLWKMCEGDRT